MQVRLHHRFAAVGIALYGAALLFGCAPVALPEGDLLVIHSATIIDPRSGSRTSDATLIIADDRIASLSDALPSSLPPGARIIDAQGKWVVPGFIDFHVHDAGEPYLRAMLAHGITSIHLMPNEPPENSLDMERESESPQALSPRLQVSRMFTGEFPDNLLPKVYQFLKPKSVDEASEQIRALHENGYRQIKIIQDDSRLWSGDDNLAPRLEPAVFDTLVAQAHARHMRVYVHATQLIDTEHAIEAGIEAFMHGTMDTLLERSDLERMAAGPTVWTPTYHALYWFGDRRRYARLVLADPRLTRLLPDDQLQQLRSQAQSEQPIVLDVVRTLVDHTDDYVSTVAENTRRVLAAGVRIAVGSDGGPPGLSTHLEMELLQENGLKAEEALAAATLGGAIALGRQNDLGVIGAGRLADLVVLNADPGVDVRNCREIEWVIKGGRAYRPEDLLGEQID